MLEIVFLILFVLSCSFFGAISVYKEKKIHVNDIVLGMGIGVGVTSVILSVILLSYILNFGIFTIPSILAKVSIWTIILFDRQPKPCKPIRNIIAITIASWLIVVIIQIIKHV